MINTKSSRKDLREKNPEEWDVDKEEAVEVRVTKVSEMEGEPHNVRVAHLQATRKHPR